MASVIKYHSGSLMFEVSSTPEIRQIDRSTAKSGCFMPDQAQKPNSGNWKKAPIPDA